MTWKELLKICILGTSNHPVKSDWEALSEWGFQKQVQPNQNVLQAAASYAFLQKAAKDIPMAKQPPAPFLEQEEARPCQRSSQLHLMAIVNNPGNEKLLLEFLEEARAAGRSLPAAGLPKLLDWGAQHPENQALLREVAAPRGVWLAQFNSSWAYMLSEIDEERWELGDLKQRRRLFQRWRQQQPQKALQALEAIWEQESLKAKTVFLQSLIGGLSDSDIPFLEKVLDESRKELRIMAADFLALLPNSPLVERMTSRCKRFVTWNKKGLQIELPEKLDEASKRDGIQGNHRALGSSLAANWLGQMLAVVPPSFWEEHLNKNISQLLKAAWQHEWSDYLLWGWIEAAVRYRAQSWLLELFTLYTEYPQEEKWSSLGIGAIFKALDEKHFNLLALQALENHPGILRDDAPVVELLLQEKQAWSDRLTLQVMRRLKETIRSDSYVYHWGLKSILSRAAHLANPELHEQLSRAWPEDSRSWHSWQNDVNDFLTTLQFRKDMRTALWE